MKWRHLTTNSKHQTMKVMQEYIPIQYEVGKQLATSLPALFLLILEVHYLLSAVQLLKCDYLTLKSHFVSVLMPLSISTT